MACPFPPGNLAGAQKSPHTRVRYLSVVSQRPGESIARDAASAGLAVAVRDVSLIEVVSCTSDELVVILDLRTSRGPLTCGRAVAIWSASA
jgi:hypothetical protein